MYTVTVQRENIEPTSPQLRISKVLRSLKSSKFLRYNLTFLFGSLAVSFLNFLFYPVLGHMLPPVEFGEVQALTSLFLQATIFLTILSYITIHVTINVPDEETRNHTLHAMERVAMIIGYTLLAVALVFVGQLQKFLNFSESWPFVSLIIAVALSIPLAFRMAYMRGKKQFFRTSLSDAIGSAAKLVLAPIAVILGWRSFGVIGALAASQIIQLLAAGYWARQAGFRGNGLTAGKVRTDLLKPYIPHAGAILLASGGLTLIQTLDVITIKHYFPSSEAGLYAGMTAIAGIIYFLMLPITGVLVTLVKTDDSTTANQNRLKASLGLMLFFGGGALLFMSLFSNFIIKVLVGSKYIPDAHFLPWIGTSMLLLGLSSAILMYHVALKRYISSAASMACFLIVLGLMLLNHASIQAVVTNIVAGSFLLFIITVSQNFYFSHRYPNYLSPRGVTNN